MSWKGLGFKSYQEYLESEFWKQKRKWILIAFGNKCCRCGTKKKLQVHHTNYRNVGNEGINDIKGLCWDCHKEEHNV